MLLQASGRQCLRALLKAEQDRSPDFLRLANALSALYPKESEEKRLLDAMLLADAEMMDMGLKKLSGRFLWTTFKDPIRTSS